MAFPVFTWRVWLLCVIAASAVAAVALHGPISQDPAYHRFADERVLLGVANLWNVISNLPFLVVGLLGLLNILSGRASGVLPGLRGAYVSFFVAAMLIGVGSAYYHWHPDNSTLVWDRLPMTLGFMAFFCAILGEHVSVSLGRRSLVPLLAAGVGSVLWWWLRGDLRIYVLVQYLPIALVPVIVILFPSRLSRVGWVWAVLGAYVLAKGLELLDMPIYHVLGISGHTLKHLAAAGGVYMVGLAASSRKALFPTHT